jgi:hypothetical protein
MVALFTRRLRLAWEFTPGLPVWRLHPPVNGRMIGEVRDPKGEHATFFALDASSGKPLWRDKELHDPWWVAIERVAGDKLVLHGYVAPDYPVLHGLTVVDIPTGNVIRTDKEWNGEASALESAGVDLQSKNGEDAPVFPETIAAGDPAAAPALAAGGWLPDLVDGPVEIAAHGNHLVCAAHIKGGTPANATLSQRLAVVDVSKGKAVFNDTLVAAAKGVAPDAFFIHTGVLYYLRERSTLCALQL